MNQRRAYIGTSGWQYRHWGNGVFYPAELKQKEWFLYYARYFNTVEVNSTFYHLLKREVFEKWRENSPEDFCFVVKASRFITHVKKLSNPEEFTAKFLERAAGLEEKLGPVLFQLPPSWDLDLARLRGFIEYLRTQTIIPQLRVTLELRNRSWAKDEVYQLLRESNIALCFADWRSLSIEEPVTADFVYLRRHGPTSTYASAYSQEQLADDAEKIKAWLVRGKDVYVYFNNDAHGWAVQNALSLKKMVAE